ncbi:5-methyltetrahydropteroyltriglutamate--homocysteine S-methyltransferase [Fulvivirga sediminis]|uniref:5-methyltetrahydropteroyltriglutamate--homocysteine methyltransferase n=1 Tax=Fulvivirga sediminis TaxID=2803949 RepID=A0A937F6V1_9BACT|nr:5-methyltetrahydropteroyltriglutamate--homocysteine S-methyltransferase [Fulvivirga sediminis]MBL3655168.1 5-methyltetrahydropteroyltriglutamate--homocysteine S-methyltransferase [Fulvivirga sediminis]
MQTHILGYPRIGSRRELKRACESYWNEKITLKELVLAAKEIREHNWKLQKDAGIDLVPSNDFSYYDQVLDMALTVNAIPDRYHDVILKEGKTELDLYFAMARGFQQNDLDITAMEMTKWFDTNYHYIVPEFTKDQQFKLFSTKIIDEFKEAKSIGITTKPVILGPVSFLLLGKEKEEGFNRLELIDNLLPVYFELFSQLSEQEAQWIQVDEPFLALDIDAHTQEIYKKVYAEISKKFPKLKILLATYFEGLKGNTELAVSLPVTALHVDLVRAPEQLSEVLDKIPDNLTLSLGLVDGRNIWKNNFIASLEQIKKAIEAIGQERVMIATSCSLLHSPCDLSLETKEDTLTPIIKSWLAFAKQKVTEVVTLSKLSGEDKADVIEALQANTQAQESKLTSALIHNTAVKDRVNNIKESDTHRDHEFAARKATQQSVLNLPLYPTTTIGSFPQTKEVRSWRAKFKKGELSEKEYNDLLAEETAQSIEWQEKIGLDVLVHGEFERNDMVEYFGEKLNGFVFTQNGWVQSYGSRCVKPPIIYGDVSRPEAMTVKWSTYAQSLTDKLVKGMLTGPVTILQWSFVRNDQSRSATCNQIALAIRDEVVDLEEAGIKVIQIDEPAIREGLPLRKSDWQAYLEWAVRAFRIAASGVSDATQIHTHMCYSEFNDIIESIAAMDADVITIECSRSQMELLDAFVQFNYPNDIGPGVYDIHSPRVPSRLEMEELLEKAKAVLPEDQLWVNPDCGLKTRGWEETRKALVEMVSAAKSMRESVETGV